MNKEFSTHYFECVFLDDKRINFDKRCTFLEEFGANHDMIMFKEKDLTKGSELLLQIIPKHQIKQIINHELKIAKTKVTPEKLMK